jgi:hypothetical protein
MAEKLSVCSTLVFYHIGTRFVCLKTFKEQVFMWIFLTIRIKVNIEVR